MKDRIRLENLRKRLREKLKTSGVDRDILDLIREIENVTNDLICVATRLRELRTEASDAAWEGKDNLQSLTRELKHYEQLAKDGVKYEPNF
jgi:predicted translin family RNA/ssDNA-binding protein